MHGVSLPVPAPVALSANFAATLLQTGYQPRAYIRYYISIIVFLTAGEPKRRIETSSNSHSG